MARQLLVGMLDAARLVQVGFLGPKKWNVLRNLQQTTTEVLPWWILAVA
jgi:hypothetical protein